HAGKGHLRHCAPSLLLTLSYEPDAWAGGPEPGLPTPLWLGGHHVRPGTYGCHIGIDPHGGDSLHRCAWCAGRLIDPRAAPTRAIRVPPRPVAAPARPAGSAESQASERTGHTGGNGTAPIARQGARVRLFSASARVGWAKTPSRIQPSHPVV